MSTRACTGPRAYTREQAVEDLLAVYAEVPSVLCKGRCADACTVIDATPLERALVAERGPVLPPAISHRVHLQLIDEGQGPRCPALGPIGNCTVYDVRPLICRIHGTWRLSACEHRCHADRYLSTADISALQRKVTAISDRWERAGRP